MRRVDCVCGGVITADPDDPAAAVARHNRTWVHRRWRGEAVDTKPCDGYRSPCCVTVPADRDLCHWCRRTRELVERVASVPAFVHSTLQMERSFDTISAGRASSTAASPSGILHCAPPGRLYSDPAGRLHSGVQTE